MMEKLEFELLENYPHVIHGVFLRHGGACGPLTVATSQTEKFEEVQQNREMLRKAMKMPKLIFPNQIHGSHIERLTARNIDRIPQADAIFTTEKNVALGVSHADCQAAIFYDPVHEAIAAVHAGWRGLVQNIYAKTLEAMRREIGTQPQNTIVCIAPSLGPDHAEYKNYKQDFPKEFWPFQPQPNHFNFWEIAKKQLIDQGVVEKNIEIFEVCTHCHADDFFSHRRKDSGRHGTIVALKA